jgi:Ca2+-binding EF-hand superfamily protein
VEADDPARNRCGCFLPDLTRLATAPSADFRERIWVKTALRASFAFGEEVLHPLFTLAGGVRRSMAISAFLLLAILTAAVPAAAPPPPPPQQAIVVTGRGGVPFISPMGEPIRARTPNEDTLARWFNQVDRNHDAFLTPDELVADAERYFTGFLDSDHDGQIDPDELVHYEWTIAPEIQVNSRLRRVRPPGEGPPKEDAEAAGDDLHGRRERRDRYRMDDGPQGAARYALLNMPQPVAAADADLNRAITLQEFRQAALDRLRLLDRNHQGRLSLAELKLLLPKLPPPGTTVKRKPGERDARIGVPLPPGN